MAMGPEPKKTTEQSMIDEFLNKGGKITKGKTKPMANELGISNNTWNNKLTKAEKDAKKNSK
jgi:DNA-binding NtrC family response regulator